MALPELLTNLASGQENLFKTLVTIGILISGHITARLTGAIIRKIWMVKEDNLTKKTIEKRYETSQGIVYFADAVVIGLALFYINSGLTSSLTQQLTSSLPNILSVVLVGLLGIIGINLTTSLGSTFIGSMGLRTYLKEMGLSKSSVKILSTGIKAFLYLVVIQIVLQRLGIGDTFLNRAITASAYATVFVLAGLIFWGFKDIFKNLAAGFYLKNTRLVRPGEKVYLEDESGKIKGIDLFSTEIETDGGYRMITKNSKVMDADLKFKNTQSNLEALEDIKDYFTAQNPSFCGPASAEMALSVFGYRYDQEEIGEAAETEEGEGTDVDELISSIEKLTDGEVRAEFVEYDKITDLGDEFKAWFNDGALTIPNFHKSALFPDASTGHYVLSTGVESDEILIVDPSRTTGTGGVYYVKDNKLQEAMGDYGHKRGYIVVAPEGTTAYWRIKNGLVYGDRTYYDELSKTLESRLRKIMRRGRILGEVTPKPIENFTEKWRSEEKISRLWSAEDDKR